ncbi:Transposon Tn7 transposition protein tnsB [Yersinia rohdei]|uniref:DDE-type integrase/transposase/recombinase n=1 Tax=Yersinia rohdei TaxID=29485 RepID=UPI0005E79FB5|nr:DDE-type integrase/transposase/recombinase [Yersinia rohdei]CNI68560.1 Transposon Tn7 transposition protein tnsB [Yersinia rohdei]
MEIAKNSVWSFKGSEDLSDGKYRIIEILNDIDCILLFPLNSISTTERPTTTPLSSFIQQVKNKNVSKDTYLLPVYLLIGEEEISEAHKTRRDKNYSLINYLVSDNIFLFDYATKKRVPYLTEHALKNNTNSKMIARLLTRYWRYGQEKMSMLSAFSLSGAAGKVRRPNEKPLGAPKISRTLSVERSGKYILGSTDKDKFSKALKKYFLKKNGLTLSKTYKSMLRDYFFDEIRLADGKGVSPHIPTQKQFNYWAKKLFSKDQVILARTTENDYLRNKRGVLGSVTQASILPGSFFEIDATVADVHIVSAFGTQYVLGRPTIYVVIDRASRMITGLHVSLFHASWRAARQALANCFLPKADYCKQFGIDIVESEWPCAHIPQSLVCDNGEMIGIKPNQVLTPMTELKFAPPYRPDCKGVVEKRFDILNKEVIHDLLGTTKGGKIVRGSRDPRKDSIYTLGELTVHLIQAVLEHNRSIIGDLTMTSPLLIENDLAPTPINYWKIHQVKHRHALKSSDRNEVISQLLPPSEVSMTRSGIYYNGLYYSCEQVEQLNLASIARTSGRWRLQARIDENTTDYIYVRLDKNKDFTKCALLPRSKMLEGKNMVEAEFVQDWLDVKREFNPISVASLDDHKRRKEMKKKAKQVCQSSSIAISERVKNIRQHRTDEIIATTNVLSGDKPSSGSAEGKSADVCNFIKALPRRKKRVTE